jgi:two-component system OmpR family response regulator
MMRVLLVDDNEAVRMTLAAILEDAGHTIIEADSLAAARALLPDARYDLVLLDVHLGDGLGPSMIPELRAALPGITIALLTGEPGLPQGADLVLEKGADPFALMEQMEKAVAKS